MTKRLHRYNSGAGVFVKEIIKGEGLLVEIAIGAFKMEGLASREGVGYIPEKVEIGFCIGFVKGSVFSATIQILSGAKSYIGIDADLTIVSSTLADKAGAGLVATVIAGIDSIPFGVGGVHVFDAVSRPGVGEL